MTEPQPDASEPLVSLTEAAQRLGISYDAARRRIARGTLPAVKVGDRWFVAAPDAGPSPNTPPATSPDPRPDAEPNVTGPSPNVVINILRDENAFLRSELEARTEEIRRRDHILAGLLQELSAIRALAPGEILDADDSLRESPESANASQAAQEAPGRATPHEMTSRTLREAYSEPVPAEVQLAVGWRRWFRWLMES